MVFLETDALGAGMIFGTVFRCVSSMVPRIDVINWKWIEDSKEGKITGGMG